MRYHFCTIATKSYRPYIQALQYSIQKQSDEASLHVLLIDDEEEVKNETFLQHHNLQQVVDAERAVDVEKYASNPDHLRWALKPVFLSYLVKQHGKVIYIDPDVFFFGPFDFIFDLLSHHSILLTPHWAPLRPLPHTSDFEMNYKIGLYNAGFIGASESGLPTLLWWRELCLYKLTEDFSNGYFVDQKYLDALLIVDEKAAILRHPGCNVGGWNIHQSKRIKKDGAVLINGFYPIIFVHFNQSTLEQISFGNDPLLLEYLLKYKEAFKRVGYDFDKLKPAFAISENTFVALKRRLRLRTRAKNFFFNLSQKL